MQVEQETQAWHVRWIVTWRDRLSNWLHKISPTLALGQGSVTKHVENQSNNREIVAELLKFHWQWLGDQSYRQCINTNSTRKYVYLLYRYLKIFWILRSTLNCILTYTVPSTPQLFSIKASANSIAKSPLTVVIQFNSGNKNPIFNISTQSISNIYM